MSVKCCAWGWLLVPMGLALGGLSVPLGLVAVCGEACGPRGLVCLLGRLASWEERAWPDALEQLGGSMLLAVRGAGAGRAPSCPAALGPQEALALEALSHVLVGLPPHPGRGCRPVTAQAQRGWLVDVGRTFILPPAPSSFCPGLLLLRHFSPSPIWLS